MEPFEQLDRDVRNNFKETSDSLNNIGKAKKPEEAEKRPHEEPAARAADERAEDRTADERAEGRAADERAEDRTAYEYADESARKEVELPEDIFAD